MTTKLPTRLASEPLVEVISEVRFDASGDAAVNLLPGILHEKFGPFDTQGRSFPLALPPEIFASDPAFAYRPQLALHKENWVIQVGAKVVSVACRAPYPGWTNFNQFAQSVFDVVAGQSFIKSFDWVSLKYVDLIRLESANPSLDWLEADIRLGDVKVGMQPCSLRVEHSDGPITTVVQIASPVQVQDQEKKSAFNGVLVDVDTIFRENFEDFRSRYREVLSELHEVNKRKFFSLLTKETESRLGPEYS